MKQRLFAFGGLCGILVAAGWWYFARVAPQPPPSASGAIRFVEGPDALARIRSGPHLAFRNTDQRKGYGRVALTPLDAPDERFVTDVTCDRVDVVAGGGVCLAADRGFTTTYEARLLDAALAPGAVLSLSGPPSRARMAPDGSFAAFTVFESGHSYASADFSTRTTLVDARTADPLDDLEKWEVLRDGAPFREADFNFWGVTFVPAGDRFYATLGTGGRIFLVEGDIAARQLRVLREGVECPSLSPDGRRLAFKSRRTEGGRLTWGLRVLDLSTGLETILDGETRSVDDQPAWLDDERVLYGLPEDRTPTTGGGDVWVLEAQAGAAPHKLLEQAWSPTVVR
jgi:dipeptidyl aminopeptidase/acylaminoacyl peptidase